MLAARLLTFPRTPWDAAELRFPFALMVGIAIAASVVTAVVIALQEPVAALLFSLSAAVMVHAPAATFDAVAWMLLALVWCAERRAGFSPLERRAGFSLPERRAGFSLPMDRLKPVLRLAAVALAIALLASFRVPEELTLPHEFSIARFTLHPWGSKLVFLPLLVAVIAGVRPALRRRELEPLAWFTLAWLAFGIAVVDPRDGVRFAVPAMLLVAIVAAEGLKVLRVGWIGAAAIAALSIFYTFPLLRERVTTPSPLSRALRAPGETFSRGEADAWGKLTRVPRTFAIERPPEFRPGVGMYGSEEGWRWVETYAELSAPRPVTLTLRLPAEAKLEANDVRVNGALVRVRRGESVSVPVRGQVAIESTRAFALDPPDTRTVAVQVR
ncbi:MAG TPA: hypothetical protein VF266_14695 [Thermoanaerobaculia bacterium]